MTPIQQRALECNRHGMVVVPLRADGSKAPAVKWATIVDQSEADVTRLVGPNTQGIGVICGAPSGGLVMFEFEGRAIDRRLHIAFRDRLIAAGHQNLYDRISAWQERTPSGGIHLHWRCPDAPTANLKLAVDTTGHVLIETRGDGGQTVIAPSHGPTHPTGEPWVTRNGSPATCPTITADEQHVVLELARSFDETPLPEITAHTPTFDDSHQPTALQQLIATYNTSHSWHDVLAGRFTAVGDPDANGVQRWRYNSQTGPTGATTNALGTDRLVIFSTTAAADGWNHYSGNGPAPSYDKFSAHTYIATGRHDIDARLTTAQALGYKTDRQLLADLQTAAANTPDPDAPTASGTNPLAGSLIDWPTFWQTDHTATQWLIEPIVAHGRAHAIYASAKVGKSYLMLAMCAAAATGRTFIGHRVDTPVDVLYVDFEMTEADLAERLAGFGYGPDDDLAHLHYALLPNLPPLNTRDGGEALLAAALACNAQLVIIDTTSRAVDGDENDSRTYHDFYNHTGIRLKRHGIAWARIDHAGKDVTKGQRGSSAKDSDVDVVLRIEKIDGGVKLKATHRRIGWYPEEQAIRIDDSQQPVVFATASQGYVAGSHRVAEALDRLGAGDEMGYPTARQLLVDGDVEHTTRQLIDAIRYRKAHPERRLRRPDPSAE